MTRRVIVSDAEVEVWKHRDPVERVKALLVHEFKVKKTALAEVTAEGRRHGAAAARGRAGNGPTRSRSPCSITPTPPPHPLIEEGRREMIEMGISGGSH